MPRSPFPAPCTCASRCISSLCMRACCFSPIVVKCNQHLRPRKAQRREFTLRETPLCGSSCAALLPSSPPPQEGRTTPHTLRKPCSPCSPFTQSHHIPSSSPMSSHHRVLARPLARRVLVARAVALVDVRDLRHERVVGVGVGQQRADREQHLGDRQRRRPLVLEDVEADRALRVDVGVVDLGLEGDLRRLEGVVCCFL